MEHILTIGQDRPWTIECVFLNFQEFFRRDQTLTVATSSGFPLPVFCARSDINISDPSLLTNLLTSSYNTPFPSLFLHIVHVDDCVCESTCLAGLFLQTLSGTFG